MGRMEGKVAIITGAASGIGAATAEILAKEGAKVVATDIQMDNLEKVVASIKKQGGTAMALELDVSSEEAWKNTVKKTVEEFGEIHVLVNNAGVATEKTIQNMEMDEWNWIQNILLNGCVLGMKYTIPEMQKAGAGSVINISSLAGLVGIAGTSPYTAAKGALRALSKAAAVEFSKDCVRVNSVYPGIIETPMTSPSMESEQGMTFYETFTQLPYLGKPEDIAHGILYFASDESRFTTGSELVIDGGWTAL